MSIKKPMLAVNIESMDTLDYPVLGSFKIDGHRAFKNKVMTTRGGNPCPNDHVRNTLNKFALEGFDGEVIVKGQKFNKVSSLISRKDGFPNFTYMVFDWVIDPSEPYYERMKRLSLQSAIPYIEFLIPVLLRNKSELMAFEEKALAEGHEGVIIRKPNSPYKFGRSTLKQGWMLKIKRFTDAEAIILDFFEQEHNLNQATLDVFGHTKRSSHQAGKVGADTLGGFIVKDIKSGVQFRLGTGEGLDATLRLKIWNNQEKYKNKIVKYKSQEYGAKDKPRIATFIGFRESWDM